MTAASKASTATKKQGNIQSNTRPWLLLLLASASTRQAGQAGQTGQAGHAVQAMRAGQAKQAGQADHAGQAMQDRHGRQNKQSGQALFVPTCVSKRTNEHLTIHIVRNCISK